MATTTYQTHTRRQIREEREAGRKNNRRAFIWRPAKVAGAFLAVAAFVLAGGVVLAFVLGQFTSGSGTVDRFTVNVAAVSGTSCAELNDPANVGSCTHSDPAAEVSLAGVYDTYSAQATVSLKNNGTTDLAATGLTIITDAPAGALSFNYADPAAGGGGLCDILVAGSSAKQFSFSVTVADASLLTGTETIAYRVDLEEAGAACTEPVDGAALTVEAS